MSIENEARLLLKGFFAEKGIPFTDELLDRYVEFCRLTLEWNEKINVTAIRNFTEFMQLNVIDSLSAALRPEFRSALKILDLGTGGGFPGMPLALAFPEKSFVLTDAVGKKLKLVDSVRSALGVDNVSTVHARAEDLARDPAYRESFDLVVSRAVANMSTLSEYCLPFVKPGGFFCAYKTESASEELDAAEGAIALLGGGEAVVAPAGIRGSGHIFAIVKKLRPTPKAYPRRAGQPSASPL